METTLDLTQFFKACNPSKSLQFENSKEYAYYIDFSSVRSAAIIEELKRTLLFSPAQPTCQLLTGHIGCGKSTELMRLKSVLEQEQFYVVYFESTQDLDMADVDITDILLAITRQVSQSLEAQRISLQPTYFIDLFNEIQKLLQSPLETFPEIPFSASIAKITTQMKDSPSIRSLLREYLASRSLMILEKINQEILAPITEALRQEGKKGLVVIIDNLDRLDARPIFSGRSQQEYIFVERGDQLRQLNCHMIYTIPLALVFSHVSELSRGLGGGLAPKVLPMVPVQQRDGSTHQPSLNLLKQMVLARAFPHLKPEQRLTLVTQVFQQPEALERLCRMSGGHMRNLLVLLYLCLQQEDPPLSLDCLENVIREYCHDLLSTDTDWVLLQKVAEQQFLGGEPRYQTLLRSLSIFQYRDQQGIWFGINPLLAEAKKLKR